MILARRPTIVVPLAALLVCGLTIAAPAATSVAATTFNATNAALRLAVPAQTSAPGYDIVIQQSPFRITTTRDGATVLQTTHRHQRLDRSTGRPLPTASGWASATSVTSSDWHDGVLDLTLATTASGYTVDYRITPGTDRYRVDWTVDGAAPAQQVATHYSVSSAGHWYGQGEAQTPGGGPYTQQPWPLDSGTVHDTAMGPAEYLMTDPFWFTQRGTGLWVDTTDVMNVSMNATQKGVFSYALTGSSAMHDTVFVERTAAAVYHDYIGIAGKPAKSDATPTEYAKPLWNSWAQSYTSVSQQSALAWAKGLHDAGIPSHTIQIDDGWSTHYGDFVVQLEVPEPDADVQADPRDGRHARAVGDALDQHRRRQLQLRRPARLSAQVEVGPEQAVQRDLVERRRRNRRPGQPGRAQLVRRVSSRSSRRPTTSTDSSSTPASSTSPARHTPATRRSTTSSSARR